MTRVDLVTGFLGAGKTTFIRRYADFLKKRGERFAIIENEFGAAGVDAALLSAAGFRVSEISGGCICCTLKVGFHDLLAELSGQVGRIIVEPSGVFSGDDFLDVINSPSLRERITPGMALGVVDPGSLAGMDPRQLRETGQGEFEGKSPQGESYRPALPVGRGVFRHNMPENILAEGGYERPSEARAEGLRNRRFQARNPALPQAICRGEVRKGDTSPLRQGDLNEIALGMDPAALQVLTAELLPVGAVLLSRAGQHGPEAMQSARAFLSALFQSATPDSPPPAEDAPWETFTGADLERLQGYTLTPRRHARVSADHSTLFQSATLSPKTPLSQEALRQKLEAAMDGRFGAVLRIKGRYPMGAGSCLVNCTPGCVTLSPEAAPGAAMLNIIGQGLDRRGLKALLP